MTDTNENVKKAEAASKQSETMEKPLPKKRGNAPSIGLRGQRVNRIPWVSGAIEDLYHSQGLNVDENGYDPDEPTPEEILSGSRSDSVGRPYFRFEDSGNRNDED